MNHLLSYFLSLFINLTVPLLVGKIHVSFTTVTFAYFPQEEIKDIVVVVCHFVVKSFRLWKLQSKMNKKKCCMWNKWRICNNESSCIFIYLENDRGRRTEAVQKELLLRCFIKLNCDSDCEDKMMLPFMTMDTAYDKTVSTVEWNAAILPTNCFLMMYDILENYTFFSLVRFVDFH